MVRGRLRSRRSARATHPRCGYRDEPAVARGARGVPRAGWGTVETGVAHGTLTVVCEGEPLEITTYRTDGVYSDGRHPDSVAPASSIEEDLQRRDFTINALAYHPARGIIDPFGGLADMERGVLRCVGDPATRFSEDALRILRACRFASQLGVAIDPATFEAMIACKNLLRQVSGERVYRELERFVCGDYVHDALMACVDVLAFVLPELVAMKGCAQVTKYHIYDVLEHTAWVVQRTPPEPLQRWSALFHDMGKPAAAFFEETDEGPVEHFYGHAVVSVHSPAASCTAFPSLPGCAGTCRLSCGPTTTWCPPMPEPCAACWGDSGDAPTCSRRSATSSGPTPWPRRRSALPEPIPPTSCAPSWSRFWKRRPLSR